MFLLRCIGTLLHARGRAIYLSETSAEAATELSVNSDNLLKYPGRTTFSQDGAWYEFSRREFSDFDAAMDYPSGGSVSLLAEVESLYEQALATFGRRVSDQDELRRVLE